MKHVRFLFWAVVCFPLLLKAEVKLPLSAKQITSNLEKLPAIYREVYQQLSSQNKAVFDTNAIASKASVVLKNTNCELSEKTLTALLEQEKQAVVSEYLDFFSVEFRFFLIASDPQKIAQVQMPPIAEVGFVGKTSVTQAAADYYKQKWGNDVSGVLAVTFEELHGKIASFVPPATKEELSWPTQWKQLACKNGKKVDIEFNSPITLKGSQALSLAVIEKVFGARYVIAISKKLGGLIKSKELLDSVLVHELRHYLDYEKNPKLFERSEKSDLELQRKIEPLKMQIQRDDFAAYLKSDAVKQWVKNVARSMAEKGPEDTFEEYQKRLLQKLPQIYLADTNRYLAYYYNEAEYSAHAEQVSFLKSAHQYTVAQVIDRLSNDRLTPQTVKLKSGEVVSLDLPPYPMQARYFTELYNKN